MFNVALLSRWHVHSHKNDSRYAKELLSIPGCGISCVWDKDERTAEEWGKEYGVPYYTDLQELLKRGDVDGVLVTSPPKDHKEIFTAAANAKKHIFTEKVLSFTLEDAMIIKNAVEKNGIRFCISFNRLAVKQLSYAKKLVDDGLLGRPVHFRCMCGHAQGVEDTLPDYWYDPEVTGGGAMMDLGFNSAYLARYVMGKIKSVSSNFSDSILKKQTEDTAVCSVKFENGATGTVESTFCSPLMSVFEMEVCFTKGAYFARFGKDTRAQICLPGRPCREISPEELPQALKSPVRAWVDACTNGAPDADYGIDAATDLVKFMTAAYRSAENGGRFIDTDAICRSGEK